MEFVDDILKDEEKEEQVVLTLNPVVASRSNYFSFYYGCKTSYYVVLFYMSEYSDVATLPYRTVNELLQDYYNSVDLFIMFDDEDRVIGSYKTPQIAKIKKYPEHDDKIRNYLGMENFIKSEKRKGRENARRNKRNFYILKSFKVSL